MVSHPIRHAMVIVQFSLKASDRELLVIINNFIRKIVPGGNPPIRKRFFHKFSVRLIEVNFTVIASE